MGHHKIVETLLARGADPNFTRVGGVSCLYIASQEGKLDVVSCLTKYAVNVTATMDDKSAALHIAARMGHRDIALHLLMHGADPNGQTRSGLTPLLIACEEGHVALVAYLLSLPIVQLDLQTHNGTTPLFIACQRGFRDIVALLLAAGANVNVAKANGTSPIDAASMLGHRDIVTLLLRPRCTRRWPRAALCRAPEGHESPCAAAAASAPSSVVCTAGHSNGRLCPITYQ